MTWEHVPNLDRRGTLGTARVSLLDPDKDGFPRQIRFSPDFVRANALQQYKTCNVYIKGQWIAVQFFTNGTGDRTVHHRLNVSKAGGGTQVAAKQPIKRVGAKPGHYRVRVERAGFVVIDTAAKVGP